jgi:signal transduction histidine kinase
MLAEFVTFNREEIIKRCREKVAKRSFPVPSEAEINHGVPLFLSQLVDALRSGQSSTAAIDESAGRHGHDLLLQGFTVSQVVHDYGDVCQTITELAVETNAPIDAEDFRMLNKCLDEAIAGAVTMYSRESHQIASATHLEATGRSDERIAFLVHELRNLIHTAMLAFQALKSGTVGISGSTGAVLDRSLVGLRDLIAHSLDDVRVTKGALHQERIVLSKFIDEVAAVAMLVARPMGITLVVSPVDEVDAVLADRQILSAVVGNLLQNAVKFTRPHGTVVLRVRATTDRLMIEVEDECGGLPDTADGGELIPAFGQRSDDRRGLGVGLVFSRWAAEASGGRLYARNLPSRGCIFTVELPRIPEPAVV